MRFRCPGVHSVFRFALSLELEDLGREMVLVAPGRSPPSMAPSFRVTSGMPQFNQENAQSERVPREKPNLETTQGNTARPCDLESLLSLDNSRISPGSRRTLIGPCTGAAFGGCLRRASALIPILAALSATRSAHGQKNRRAHGQWQSDSLN